MESRNADSRKPIRRLFDFGCETLHTPRQILIRPEIYCELTSTSIEEVPLMRHDVPLIESLNESVPRAPGFER